MPKSDYQSQLNLIHNLSAQAQRVQGYQACKIKWDKYTVDPRGLTGSASCVSMVMGYDDEPHNLWNQHANKSQTLANWTHFAFNWCCRSCGICKPICDICPHKCASFPVVIILVHARMHKHCGREREEKGSERKTKLKSSSEQPAGSQLPSSTVFYHPWVAARTLEQNRSECANQTHSSLPIHHWITERDSDRTE